jgi:hypothetical protein
MIQKTTGLRGDDLLKICLADFVVHTYRNTSPHPLEVIAVVVPISKANKVGSTDIRTVARHKDVLQCPTLHFAVQMARQVDRGAPLAQAVFTSNSVSRRPLFAGVTLDRC